MTQDDFNDLLAEQGGCCAICESDDPGREWWSVDHDHATGAVRGLLCNNCNAGLGMFKDSPELIRAAYEYLAWHEFRQDMESQPDYDPEGVCPPATGAAPDWFVREVLTY